MRRTRLHIILTLLVLLAAGRSSWAMVTGPMTFEGRTVTVDNQSRYTWSIHGFMGAQSRPVTTGSSQVFDNTEVFDGLRISGTLNFVEASTFTDVVTGSQVILEFQKSDYWFFGATVKTSDDVIVPDCLCSISDNKHSVTVTIPSGKSFGIVYLEYVPNAPMSYANTNLGIAEEYVNDGVNEPEPVVVYYGSVTLTRDVDYTVAYEHRSFLKNRVIVTGIGNYYGTVQSNYKVRGPQFSDFNMRSDGSYEITSKEDLYNLAVMVNGGNECNAATFVQTVDIVCDSEYIPIGNMSHPFCGIYDGQGHTISGITVNRTGTTDADECVGLFGFCRYTRYSEGVYSMGYIKNVVLANSTFTGYRYVGAIAGRCASSLFNCKVENTVTINAGANYAQLLGGIVGYFFGGDSIYPDIEGSFCAATVSSNGKTGCQYFGGMIGFVECSSIKDCLFTGNMDASGVNNVGAIAGWSEDNQLIHSQLIQNNYYVTDGISGAIDGSDVDGARRARTVSLGSHVSLAGDATTYNVSGLTAIGTRNYALRTSGGTIYSGEGQTLTYLEYRGSTPSDKTILFTLDGEYLSGNYFMMPDRNVNVGVAFISSDLFYLTGCLCDGVYWSTFYHGSNRYTLPEGAMAYTMNSSKNLYRLGTDGRTIPAGTAVVIISDKAEFFLTKSDDTTPVAINGGDNILQGYDTEHDSFYYHCLRVVNNTIGFYRLRTTFIPAHKAYYVQYY